MPTPTTVSRHPVLIIEDDPILRIDALSMIERAGLEAVEAWSVDEAIRLLETRPDIRVVYMDLDMPRGVRGIEIAARIRDRWPPIEIILTAAFHVRGELELPDRAEFYPKPIQYAEVMTAMRRLSERVGA